MGRNDSSVIAKVGFCLLANLVVDTDIDTAWIASQVNAKVRVSSQSTLSLAQTSE